MKYRVLGGDADEPHAYPPGSFGARPNGIDCVEHGTGAWAAPRRILGQHGVDQLLAVAGVGPMARQHFKKNRAEGIKRSGPASYTLRMSRARAALACWANSLTVSALAARVAAG